MKKVYLPPELELVKFNFGRMMQTDDYDNIRHSVVQDIGEGSDVLEE